MKKLTVWIACTAIMLVTTNIALAQGRGKTHTTKAAGSTRPAPVAKGGGSTKTHGPSMKGPKTTQTANTKATAVRGGQKAPKLAKVDGARPKDTTKTSRATSGSTTTATTTTSGGTSTVLTPVQQKLQRNTNLASKLESRLPKGTDLMLASEGFRNLGQFVAAVNASHNHDLDFVQLKTAMVDEGMSLGQAMKDQRSTLTTTDATQVQREADALVTSTEQTSGTAVKRTSKRTGNTPR